MICCFIGDTEIKESPELTEKLTQTLYELIRQGVTDFLFGDYSDFTALCYATVTELKQKYPQLRRIHYRTAYKELNNSVIEYSITEYEDNICPKSITTIGKEAYAERNRAMIHDSDICVFYYDEQYQPSCYKQSNCSLLNYLPKNTTQQAFEYAVKCNKRIFNIKNNISCQ